MFCEDFLLWTTVSREIVFRFRFLCSVCPSYRSGRTFLATNHFTFVQIRTFLGPFCVHRGSVVLLALFHELVLRVLPVRVCISNYQ
jgi:hypothetical protein